MNSPIMLNASVTVPTGAMREPEQTALTNPFRTAMLIDEIRMRIELADLNYANCELLKPRIQFFLGRVPLMNQYTPIVAITKYLTGGAAVPGQTDPSFLFVDWKLPRPLYVPATEYLIPRVYNAIVPGETPQDVSVSISYAGRSLPSDYKVPERLFLPWVANYTSPTNAYNANAEETTTESDIVNPFNEPIYIQRFVGVFSDSFNSNVSARGSLYTTVTAVDSFGNVLIRDRTPFSHLFSTMDKTWPAKTVLQPKGFYIFNVRREFDGLPSDGNTLFQYSMSMLGYREVFFR